METKILKILNNVKIGSETIENAQKQILELINDKKSKTEKIIPVEVPVLIGHLNKPFGYNGIQRIEIGTDVLNFRDRYYFEMIPIGGGKPIIQKFYKHMLAPCIDFIGTER